MERVYFINSDDKKENNNLIDRLKTCLPTDIDIVRLELVGESMIDSTEETVAAVPAFLELEEMPLLMAEDAYKTLTRERNPKVLKKDFYNQQIRLYERMHREERIIAGHQEISDLIRNKLNINSYSWPPK